MVGGFINDDRSGTHAHGDGSNGGDTIFGGLVFAGGGTGGMAIQYDGAGSGCDVVKLRPDRQF